MRSNIDINKKKHLKILGEVEKWKGKQMVLIIHDKVQEKMNISKTASMNIGY